MIIAEALADEITAANLIKSYKADCETQGLTAGTIERYISAVRSLNRYLEKEKLDILGTDDEILIGFLEHLRKDKCLRQRTIQHNFAAICSYYDFLEYKRLVGKNPVNSIRKRYLRKRHKDNDEGQERKLISIEEMSRMINSTMDIKDKAIITLLAKTGIRRNELITLDVSDIDFVEQKIILKPTAKRTNRTIFFDDETALLLSRWLREREGLNKKGLPALFLNDEGTRMMRHAVYDTVVSAAKRVGLHNTNSTRMKDHFSPHCCRHWFTTYLRRAGMSREFIQELRGDKRREAMDIYDHIDEKELRESYLAHIPQLGV